MEGIWHKFVDFADRINRIGLILAEIALILLLILVFHEVVARYFLDRPTLYSVELSEYLLIFIAFIPAGWLMREKKHVQMESFIHLMPWRVRNLLDCITSTVVFVFCVILIWQGTKSALIAFQGDYHSSSLLNVPLWITYSIIPIGSFLLAVQVIVRIITAVGKAIGRSERT